MYISTILSNLGLMYISNKEEKEKRKREVAHYAVSPNSPVRQNLALDAHHNKGGLCAMTSHQGLGSNPEKVQAFLNIPFTI